MTSQEKHKYAYALTSIASTGLSFIEDSLSRIMNDGTDMAYLRSFYILLSYNFELVLKSRIVMLNDFSDKNSINEDLRKLSHDIMKIKEVLVNDLQELGIKEITQNGARYEIITTDDKKIQIEDFTKVRYDFLDDVMRNIDNQEHVRIKEYVEMLVSILRKAKQKNEEAKNQP